MPVGLAGLGALGLDRETAIVNGHLDVIGGIDARKLGAHLVEPVLGLVLETDHVAVEKRAQAREAGEGGEARKRIEELGKLRQQGARLTLNSKLIHDSSRVGRSDS